MSYRTSLTPAASPWARPLLSGIATLGSLGTAYLTWVKLSGGTAACGTQGCDTVLNSVYGELLGFPLPLFGFGAYGLMLVMASSVWLLPGDFQPGLRSRLDALTWQGLFLLSVAMAVFSAYLMGVLATELKVLCLYCIGSAFLCLGLLLTTLLGRRWSDWGQLGFNGTIVIVVAIVGITAFNAQAAPASSVPSAPQRVAGGYRGAPVQTASSAAAIGLARHLAATGATMYGAYWCSHCHDQKRLFGQEAAALLPYVECDPKGFQASPAICKAAEIDGYPTWVIGDLKLSGTQDLADLALASHYSDFPVLPGEASAAVSDETP